MWRGAGTGAFPRLHLFQQSGHFGGEGRGSPSQGWSLRMPRPKGGLSASLWQAPPVRFTCPSLRPSHVCTPGGGGQQWGEG